MNKLNICIDIDGTITDPYHFLPYLNELYNKLMKNVVLLIGKFYME